MAAGIADHVWRHAEMAAPIRYGQHGNALQTKTPVGRLLRGTLKNPQIVSS
jgi:hypothetical protein